MSNVSNLALKTREKGLHEILEDLIDAHGLSNVLLCLSEACGIKAESIREEGARQDLDWSEQQHVDAEASAWEDGNELIGNLAHSPLFKNDLWRFLG